MTALYICVEERQRELLAKLLVACFLAESGRPVVIGQQWLLKYNMRHMPRGLVYFKGVDALQVESIGLARSLGHVTVAIDEEMLAQTSANDHRQVPDLFADSAHYVVAQGARYVETFTRRFPTYHRRLLLCGNARTDLLRPEFRSAYGDEVAELRARHGRFILVNTNYGALNGEWNDLSEYFDVCVQINWLDPNKPEDLKLFDDLVAWERRNRANMRHTIDWLQRNVDLKLVVRPHPMERAQRWRDWLGDRQNVAVDEDGSHIAAILASELLVHTSCTTGLEAVLLDKTAVNLVAGADPYFDESYLTTIANPVFPTIEAAAPFVEAVVRGEDAMAARRDDLLTSLGHHLHNIRGDLAAEKTARSMAWILDQHFGPATGEPWQAGPDFVRSFDRHSRFEKKFTLSQSDMAAEVDYLRRALGRFGGVRVSEIGDSLFLLQPPA